MKGLERRKMTYFVDPLQPGEESITEYLAVENVESADELSNSGRNTGSTTSLLNKGRSPSISTNASFSLIAEPSLSGEGHSLKRRNYSKKISIESNSSTSHGITVPIIEESSSSLTSTNPSSTNIRRNQVSPADAYTNPPTDGSFAAIVGHEDGLNDKRKRKQNSRKKCTIS